VCRFLTLAKIMHRKIKIDAFNFGSSFRIIMTYTELEAMESGNSDLVGTAESLIADVSSRLLVF